MSNEDFENSIKSGSALKLHEVVKQNPNLLNSLRQLGLNEYQAKVFLALSVLGKSTAGEISEKSDVPRARAYDVLEELSTKGFAAIKSGRPVQYAAIPVSEAVKTLKRQKETALQAELEKIESIGETLKSTMKGASVREGFPVEENVWTLRGRDAIYSKMASMISEAKNQVILSSSAEGVCRKVLAHQKEFDRAKSRGVKFHVVAQIPKTHEAWKTCGTQLNNSTIHDKTLPSRMLLSDDQALLFLTHENSAPEDEVGLWIKSPHFVSTIREAVPALCARK
ncbi:MAG: helix-turn-helix domain-containing protein [Candidatus Micrarchaeia archaeon]